MDANNFLFKASHGKRTTLDKAYYNHINYILGTLDEEQENRWETYNLVILELVNQGNQDCFKEIKYRLTDGEDPNKVMLDIIEREVDNVTGLVWFLKRRIEEYVDDDYFKRFLL